MLCTQHGESVPQAEYDYKAAMCYPCTRKCADLYGISRADVSFVGTAKMNLVGYFKGVPGEASLDERTKIRILLLLLGVQFDATDLEKRGAAWFKDRK